jgi:hypothetical protein
MLSRERGDEGICYSGRTCENLDIHGPRYEMDGNVLPKIEIRLWDSIVLN